MTTEDHANAILRAAFPGATVDLLRDCWDNERNAILAAVRAVYEDGVFAVTNYRASVATLPAPELAAENLRLREEYVNACTCLQDRITSRDETISIQNAEILKLGQQVRAYLLEQQP